MYRRSISVFAILAAVGCNAPEATSTDAAPAPVVSHAVASAAPEAPSTTAHHVDSPVTAPEVDPVRAPDVAPVASPKPDAIRRELTIPAGTPLSLELATTVSSNGSRVEQPVQATVRRAVVIKGATVIPAGAAVTGYVTEATPSGRVKGRARVGVRFSTLRVGGTRYTIRTAAVTREAPGTKKEDATKVGIGAGAGAVVGAIAGGKKGAAVGTAVGAAGGTGVVLATRGEEVSLGRGTVVSTRLSQPVTIRVR